MTGDAWGSNLPGPRQYCGAKALHRETQEVRMVDKHNDAHERIEHRYVAANKPRNRH